MTKILRSDENNNAGSSSITQSGFQSQISAQVDALRQLVGRAEIAAGATVNDPLNAPYVLYVNPFTGTDTFVGGSYSTSGTAVQRIEKQRLECGYTQARPFRTINRAILEAGIITAKSFYENPLTNTDLVSIVLAPGVYDVLNGAGSSVSAWADGKNPTDNELAAFNPDTTGGILLPRGVSLCSLDLRKTIIRPQVVPSKADEAADASNRRTIFKVTGGGYYFGFTFMDKAGSTDSHHLLHCFEFASQSELEEFYGKIDTAFTTSAGLTTPTVRSAEYEIVGPKPAVGAQTEATDTTLSASPYIFNCSIRSRYGLCGVYADGNKPAGFRSMVIAQFTGVSLQKDLTSWQKYSSGTWGSVSTYSDYINTSPDDVRMNPARRSFHVRAVNDAIIQEVSVFAIGQGVHHWTQSGGELTITNSNSNFGGCAAISEGYRSTATAADSNWNISRLRVANNLSDLDGNVQRIYLGTIASVTSSTITLTTDLGDSLTLPGTPDVVARDGYTLRDQTYVWVENPTGFDWRSTFAATAWSSGTPGVLNIRAALTDENGDAAGTTDPVGKRVYIRRLVDTRTPEQRRYSLKLANTTSIARLPIRDYALQLTPGDDISGPLPQSATLTVSSVGKLPASEQGVTQASEVVLRCANTERAWTGGTYYRKGETVTRNNKHLTCIQENSDANFDTAKWEESYVHMASTFYPEDFHKTIAPILIFDRDTAGTQDSTTLGYNLSTVWTTDALIQAQYRSAGDYRGLHRLLTALGFSSANAHTLLVPQAEADRDLNPSSSSDMGGLTPSGGLANGLANWPVEFRRPSIVRLFSHAWEWAGYLNYTKALPLYQKQISNQNKFGYYFTNVDGGRVYATGFNEEGYEVTPQGLTDIATGETISVEDLGTSDINIPTQLNNVTLKGTTTIDDTLVINASTTFNSGSAATTSKQGVARIATTTELTNPTVQSTVSPQARFVTPEGLQYWKQSQGLLSQRTGTTTFYVVPDNAVNGGTYVFDGTSATLTADPGRSGSAIATDPPTTRAKAVYFSSAVAYANANYSSLETVNYQLAKGPYYTSIPAFNHIANIYGDRAKFPSLVTLPDFTAATTPARPAGGSNPTVKELVDGFEVPCFATVLTPSLTSTSARINFVAQPISLTLNYGGTVQGVAWKSVTDTFQNESNYPNSIFNATLATLRSASKTVAEAMSDYIDANDTITDSYLFDKFYSNHTIVVKSGSLSVWDCIFGAKASGLGSIGYGVLGSIVFCTGACSVNMNGIYLWGNTIVTSLPGLGKTLASIGTSAIYGARNSQYLIASRGSNAQARDITVTFNFRDQGNLTGASYDRDYNRNCIHVLDNDGYYALKGSANANLTSLTGSRGASFVALFGEMAPGSRIFTGGYSSYQSGYTNTNKHHGIAGVFGHASLINGSGVETSTSGPKGIDGGLDPLSLYRFASYHSSLWQQARTGTLLTKGGAVTLTGGPGQQIHPAYTNSSDNVLNINSSVFVRGVDIDTAQIVGGAFTAAETVSGTSRSVFYG